MSYSAIYRVSRTSARMVAEFRNGWGTGPLLWGILCRDYLHTDENGWLLKEEVRSRLWALTKDQAVPLPLRIAHALTFDRAIVRFEDREEMALACDQVWEAAYAAHPEHANHWGEIAEFLRNLKKPANPKTLGCGLNCTSVSDVWSDFNWQRGRGQPPWDCVAAIKAAMTPAHGRAGREGM